MSRKISSAGVNGKYGMSIGAINGVPNDSSFCQEPGIFIFGFENPSLHIITAIGSKP